MEIVKPEGSLNDSEDKSISVVREKENADNKDVRMEDTRSSHSSNELSSTITNEEVSSVCNDKEFKSPSFEATHQFHIRNKQGSKLTISKGNYHLLTQGKTLMFYNAKLGSFMEIKIANMLDEKTTRNRDVQPQEKVRPMQCETLSSLTKIKQDNADSEEMHSEVGSCMTSEDGHHTCEKYSFLIEDDCATSSAPMPSQIYFSANSKCKVRRKSYDIKTHNLSRGPAKIGKRRKLPKVKNASCFSTDFVCGCRFEVGKKRKFAHLRPMDFHFPFRKKLAPHECWSDKTFLSPIYCINACKVDSTSTKNVVSSCTRVRSCASLVQLCPNICLELQGSSQETVEGTCVSATVARKV